MALNLSKNIIAVAIGFLIHVLVLAAAAGRPIFQAPRDVLDVAGVERSIGVAAGDTLYFRSLQILGPRRALMMSTTSPLFAVVLGAVLLGEDLRFMAVSGIVITVAGVIVVVADRKPEKKPPESSPDAHRWVCRLESWRRSVRLSAAFFQKRDVVCRRNGAMRSHRSHVYPIVHFSCWRRG